MGGRKGVRESKEVKRRVLGGEMERGERKRER